METLTTSWLVYEFEQFLHSRNDYTAALEHTLTVCRELDEYMAELELVLTSDYPTWKYNKKLVAEVHIMQTQEKRALKRTHTHQTTPQNKRKKTQ